MKCFILLQPYLKKYNKRHLGKAKTIVYYSIILQLNKIHTETSRDMF